MSLMERYREKVITAEQAAALVKSGMLIDYPSWMCSTVRFDEALGKRAGEPGLEHVTIRGGSAMTAPPSIVAQDPEGKTFTYGSRYFSGIDRKLSRSPSGIAYYVNNYHEQPSWCTREDMRHKWPDIFVVQTCPMDNNGFFNFGISNSYHRASIEGAKIVIVEINENLPRVFGGFGEGLTLDEVDYIIDDGPTPLPLTPPAGPPTPEEQKIVDLIVPEIRDGSCLQLGIGGMPNAIGTALANSDLKDLGVHTEMFCEAFMSLHKAGKITNRNKTLNKYKSCFTFALGSQELVDFMRDNPLIASAPCDYVNNFDVIRSNPRMVSINNCVEVDLMTQVCSESTGYHQISGSGGQLDFANAAYESEEGQSFIAFTSTYTDKAGKVHSRIRPTLTPGGIVSTPRTHVHWLVTEYGKINVKAMSNWERTEALISIAHPDFRDELIREAEAMGLWHPSNKIR